MSGRFSPLRKPFLPGELPVFGSMHTSGTTCRVKGNPHARASAVSPRPNEVHARLVYVGSTLALVILSLVFVFITLNVELGTSPTKHVQRALLSSSECFPVKREISPCGRNVKTVSVIRKGNVAVVRRLPLTRDPRSQTSRHCWAVKASVYRPLPFSCSPSFSD